MQRKLAVAVGMMLLSAVVAMAEEPASAPKELAGMSILGNDDAPKSLYIVPWKSSEIGMETSLARMLTAAEAPVDREVFQRELDFYQVSAANRTPPALGGEAIAGAAATRTMPQF